MRIKEGYKKSGYFWLPENIENKIPGSLSILDGGKIELEIIGSFNDSIQSLNDKNEFKRIVGVIENDGLVTLENCFYKTRSHSFGGISKSFICVNKLLSGVAYDKDEEIKFNTFSFGAEGLDEWIDISGINVEYEKDWKSATINYSTQKEITYELDNEIKLHVTFGYTLPSLPVTREAKITQKTYLKLTSDTELELHKFTSYAYKLINLISFAVDDTVTMDNVTATSESLTHETNNGESHPIPIKIYYPSLPFSETVLKVNTHTMLFTFRNIMDRADKIIKNWVSAYDTIEPSLNLYFSVKTGNHKYLEGKFLALAQALETYHRRVSNETLMDTKIFRSMVARTLCSSPKSDRAWLKGRLIHGNELHLGKRIKMIIEPYKEHIGTSKERGKLIRNIVNTRNYLTHYSENLKSKAVTGIDLWPICQKMEAIFQLHLLDKLGFTSDEINIILSNNYKLNQKIKEN